MPHYIEQPTMGEIRQLIEDEGQTVTVGENKTREVLSTMFSWPLGMYPARPGQAHRLIVAETYSMLVHKHIPELLFRAAPKANKAMFTQEMAYGPRTDGQLFAIVKELMRDPASRRAIMYVGTPRDKGSEHTPCTNTYQFIIRKGKLHMHVSMRSWDGAYGLPIDVGVAGGLGLILAHTFEVLPGTLTMTAGSFHLYDSTAHLAQTPEEAGQPLPPFRQVQFVPEKDAPYLLRATNRFKRQIERVEDAISLALSEDKFYSVLRTSEI